MVESMFNRKVATCGILLMVALVLVVYFDVSPSKIRAFSNLSGFETPIDSKNESKIGPLISHQHSNTILIPDEGALRNMSMVNLVKFYHSYVVAPQVTCNGVTRMGSLLDGGWELCEDPQYRPVCGNCLVYSYGINNDFSFDNDMVKYGCEVHAFDPTMGVANDYTTEAQVRFHPRGIGGSDRQVMIPKQSRTIRAQVDTIATHRRMYEHQSETRRLDVVKIDVEGFELESLMTSLDDGSLADARQLNFETHLMMGGSREPTQDSYIKYLLLLKKVYSSGFRIYTSHRNYAHSRFFSSPDRKYHAFCHEIHTVNILNRNS